MTSFTFTISAAIPINISSTALLGGNDGMHAFGSVNIIGNGTQSVTLVYSGTTIPPGSTTHPGFQFSQLCDPTVVIGGFWTDTSNNTHGIPTPSVSCSGSSSTNRVVEVQAGGTSSQTGDWFMSGPGSTCDVTPPPSNWCSRSYSTSSPVALSDLTPAGQAAAFADIACVGGNDANAPMSWWAYVLLGIMLFPLAIGIRRSRLGNR
jgi:hypothetical protein